MAELFATLDDLDQRLATRRYLFGDSVTEADVRLWVTLARFDAVYVTHFKANLRRLADYPNLWPYARDLYSLPAFGGTHQLRPHQEPLLPDPPAAQPAAHRARRAHPGLDRAARTGRPSPPD